MLDSAIHRINYYSAGDRYQENPLRYPPDRGLSSSLSIFHLFNPLSPSIHKQILQTDLYTFP